MKSALKKSSDCAKITCAGYTVKLKTDLATLLTLPPEETPAPFIFRESHEFKDATEPLFLAGFSNDWKKHIKTKGWLRSPENAHTWLGTCVRKDDEMHLTIRKGKLKQTQFKAAIKKNAALKKLTWHITEAIQEGEDDDLLNDDLHESDEDEPQKTPAQSEMLQQQAHTFQTELVDLLKQLKGATPEAKRVILGNVEQIAAQLYQIPNWQKYTDDKVEGYLEQVETFLAQQNKEDSPSLASELNRIHRLIEQEAAAFKTATSKEEKTAILGKIVKLLQQWDTTAESATPEDFTDEQRVEIPTIKAQIKKIAPNASIKEGSIPRAEPQKIPIDIRIAKLAPITLTVPLSYSIEDVINELLSGGGAEYRKEILSVVIESASGTQLKPVSNYKATLADYGIQARQSLRLRVEQEGLLGGTPLWEIAIASAFAAGIFLLIYLGSKYFGKRPPKNLQVTVHVHSLLPTITVSALDTDTVQNILDKVSTTNLQQVTALSIGGIDVTGRRGETLQQLGIQDDTDLNWEFEPNLANITTWANAVWVETPTHASTLLVENIITTNNITADLTLWNQVKAYNNVCAKLQTFVLANDQTNIATIQAAINKLTINSLDASAALMDAALKWGDDNTLEALSECSLNQLTTFNTLTNNGLIGHLRSLPKDDRLNILTALESKSALESTFAKLANNNNLAKFLQCSTEQLTAFNSLDDNDFIKHIEGLDENKFKTTLDALQNLTELPKTFTKLTDKANLEKFLQCSTEQLTAFNSLDDNNFIKHIEGLDENKFKTTLDALQNLTELPKTFTKLTDKANLEKFLKCSKEQLTAFNSLDTVNDSDFIKHIEGLDENKIKATLDALQNLTELPKTFTKLTDKANLEKFLKCSKEQLTAFNSLDDNDFIKHIEGLDENKIKATLDALQNLTELPKTFTKLTDKANLEKFFTADNNDLKVFNTLDTFNSSKITKFADLHKFIEDKSDANAVKDLLGKLTANGSLINIWELLAANMHNANANFDKFTGLTVAEAENYLTIMTNSKNGTIIHAKRPNIQTAVLSLAAPDIPQFITDFVHDTTGALTFINDIKTTYPTAVRATPQKFIETWKELASTPATSTQRSKKLFFEEIYNVEEESHAGVFNDIEDHTRGVIKAGTAKGGHFLGSTALQPVTPPPPPSTWIYPPDNNRIHIDTTKIQIGTPANPVKVKVNGSKINGTLKAEVNTYFPRGWSMNKILAEIAFALANGNTMTNGQKLIIWKKGNVVESAYPK